MRQQQRKLEYISKAAAKWAWMAVAAAVTVGCGPSASVDRDSGTLSEPDGGEDEVPPAPTLQAHPSPFPYTVATLRGEAPNADRIVVTGSGNPLTERVLTEKSFCIDVPMPVPQEYTFEVRSHNGVGPSEQGARTTIEFDPEAPEPSADWTTCDGSRPGPCPREMEICDDGKDNDCDGRVDDRDSDCSDCDDDPFENNDDVRAPRIETGRHEHLMLCPDDPDFYAIPAEKGETIDVRLFFIHEEGNLDLQLFGADKSEVVDKSESTDDDESLTYEATKTGEHVVHIYGVDGASGSYALQIEVTTPSK